MQNFVCPWKVVEILKTLLHGILVMDGHNALRLRPCGQPRSHPLESVPLQRAKQEQVLVLWLLLLLIPEASGYSILKLIVCSSRESTVCKTNDSRKKYKGNVSLRSGWNEEKRQSQAFPSYSGIFSNWSVCSKHCWRVLKPNFQPPCVIFIVSQKHMDHPEWEKRILHQAFWVTKTTELV